MNLEQCSAAAEPQTKSTDLCRESSCSLLSSAPTASIGTIQAQGSRASQVPVVCADLPRPQRHCTSLPRWSDQSLEHVNTSDQPRRQPYWHHPRVVRLGDRSFPVVATRAWNALPQHIQNAPSLSIFRRELKTVLFRSSFPDVIWQCTVLYLCVRRSVLICHHVLAATNWFCWHCDNAT